MEDDGDEVDDDDDDNGVSCIHTYKNKRRLFTLVSQDILAPNRWLKAKYRQAAAGAVMILSSAHHAPVNEN